MPLRTALTVATVVMILVSSANAKTELEKFTATLPATARMGFAEYKACAMIAGGAQKRDGAAIELTEKKIAAECNKDLAKADRELARAGLSREQRVKAIERFSLLAAAERRLNYEGKPVPGEELDPELARVVQCLRRSEIAQGEYANCVNEALQKLIPYSTDPSNVVADAALGMCLAPRGKWRAAVRCSIYDQGKADAVASQWVDTLRSWALGKVAAARASKRQQELIQQGRE
jgi:hypothetical protein